jgi:hypothetical protein
MEDTVAAEQRGIDVVEVGQSATLCLLSNAYVPPANGSRIKEEILSAVALVPLSVLFVDLKTNKR